ncbi:MAG: CoA-binding protein [Phycisphaerae bacterium]|nr:CoA-binding protein [Phycisphaerae bacterium]
MRVPNAGTSGGRNIVTSLQDRIDGFLNGKPHAVVGASTDRSKYGNKVLRVYQQNGRPVYAVNPKADTVEGLPTYADLTTLPVTPHGVSIVTPPKITERIVQQAIELGIRHLWMQPGAESPTAVAAAEEAGINVIGGDACLLVVLGYHE